MNASSILARSPRDYRRKVSPSLLVHTGAEVAEILRYLPPRPHYADWVRIISAVGSVLPTEEAVSVLSAWSPEETQGEYASKLGSRLTSVGIGTLIHMAKKHGFDAVTFYRSRNRSLGRRRLHSTNVTPGFSQRRLPRYTPRSGSIEELETLAKLRRLPSTDGLDKMQASGCLAFSDNLTDQDGDGNWRPVKAWLVKDPSGRNVSARRLDGLGWNCAGGAKSRCLSGPGSKSWPVGLSLAKPGQRLDVVEGEGDLVALWHLHALTKTHDAVPVGLLGSCVNLDTLLAEISSFIAGRTIQIFVHRDSNGAGQIAAKKWADSFYRLGATKVCARDLTPWLRAAGKDLNDALATSDGANASMTAE